MSEQAVNRLFRDQVPGTMSEILDYWSFDMEVWKKGRGINVSAPIYAPGQFRGDHYTQIESRIMVYPPGWFAWLFPHYSFKARVDRAYQKLYRKAEKFCIEQQKRDDLIQETLDSPSQPTSSSQPER